MSVENLLKLSLPYYLEAAVTDIYFPISGAFLIFETESFPLKLLQQGILLAFGFALSNYYKREAEKKEDLVAGLSRKIKDTLDFVAKLIVVYKIGHICNFVYSYP